MLNEKILVIKKNNFRKCLRNSSLILAMFGFTYSVLAMPLYRITDLGPVTPWLDVRGNFFSIPVAINDSGQVTLYMYCEKTDNPGAYLSFRSKANSAINFDTDDIGFLHAQENTMSVAINNSGQVAGNSFTFLSTSLYDIRGFRTAPNKAINPAKDDLGTLNDLIGSTQGHGTWIHGINDSGQVVGVSETIDHGAHAFRTAPNKKINPTTDDLGTLGGEFSQAHAINNLGQVVGKSARTVSDNLDNLHAFRTAPNKAINPTTDDLGSLGGDSSNAHAINNFGQVVGVSLTVDHSERAFRTAPNKAINPSTDDLGTLGGGVSQAYAINSSGNVVGTAAIYSQGEAERGADPVLHAFLYTKNSMYDLNDLIPSDSEWKILVAGLGINKTGQIVGIGRLKNGEMDEMHAFRLDQIK